MNSKLLIIVVVGLCFCVGIATGQETKPKPYKSFIYRSDKGQLHITDMNRFGDFCGYVVNKAGHTEAIFFKQGSKEIVYLGTVEKKKDVSGEYLDQSHVPQSKAIALNDYGQVVGVSDTGDITRHTFLWQNGVMKDCTIKRGLEDKPVDINNRGEVVGTLYVGRKEHGYEATHAFAIKSSGSVIDLSTVDNSRESSSRAVGINDNGVIVGMSQGHSASNPNPLSYFDSTYYPFICKNTHTRMKPLTLPGGNTKTQMFLKVRGINNHGDYWGAIFIADHVHYNACMIRGGKLTVFLDDKYGAGIIETVTNTGEILGFIYLSRPSPIDKDGFRILWRHGHYAQGLNSVVRGMPYSNRTWQNRMSTPIITYAAINDSGMIAGFGELSLGVGGIIVLPPDVVLPDRSALVPQAQLTKKQDEDILNSLSFPKKKVTDDDILSQIHIEMKKKQ